MTELVKKELLSRSDMEVKVSIASCINQILRITSPNAPYGDEQMKLGRVWIGAKNGRDEAEDQNLKQDLMVAANAHISPPSSVEELLSFLESESKSTLRALDPAIKALTAKDLFNHLDVDVKVLVVLCINEIMRITAPDIPFGDEQMLKMDADFLNLIPSIFRENHPDVVFSSMGKSLKIVISQVDGGEEEKVANLNKSESLSSDDIKNGEASQPKNVLLENQSKGTSVPKGKRSSNKVDSENDGNEMNSVLGDAMLNGAGISDDSEGKPLEAICMKDDLPIERRPVERVTENRDSKHITYMQQAEK
ncbi:unnamed protein product [Dovyalis caffra]|uniref:Uncharacterized protein n=1 Tax=Dovyalis caffra TaxID=77055 RepID=A0AAV1RSG6_9ROSI|nr:unnamed protein product [Dovyalis caffra]